MTRAQQHLDRVVCCAARGAQTPAEARLLATPHVLSEARARVTALARLLAETTTQLELFGG